MNLNDHARVSTAEGLSWRIDGLSIEALAWGPEGGVPVLALHGWLDNAASFEILAPLLSGCRVVAPDLTGHGLSDHRSPDATYQIWDDIPQLLGLLDRLGWDKCVLLGHSRGGIIATLLAAAMPERVSALVTLDGLTTSPVADSDFVRQLHDFLTNRKRHGARSERVFPTREDFIERRSHYGVPADIAARLSVRALEETDGGYRLRADPRLYGASAVKLNEGQIAAVLRGLAVPVLCVWASRGLLLRTELASVPERAKELVTDLSVATVEGHHHFHMETDAAWDIAGHVARFLDSLETSA